MSSSHAFQQPRPSRIERLFLPTRLPRSILTKRSISSDTAWYVIVIVSADPQGGLDCRYLISELHPTRFKIISLTTISTPHRGSPLADYVIDNLIGRESISYALLTTGERLPSLLALMNNLRLPDSGDGSAFSALGTHSMKEFNAEIVDDEAVTYFSWGASYEPGPLDPFRWSNSVILAKEGPNDGLVSVHSARWGEYRGTLLGVNHVDL